MGLLDYTLQHQGSPWGLHEPGLLHRPPPPSPNSFQRPLARGKSTPSHPAPGESIKPVLLPADPPRESRSAAGAGPARLPGRCQPRPPGICHQAKPCGAAARHLPRVASSGRSQLARASTRGPAGKRRKYSRGGGFPSSRKGRRGGGFVVICGGFVCTEIPSTRSGVSLAAALAGIHADQLFDIFTSVSPSCPSVGSGLR